MKKILIALGILAASPFLLVVGVMLFAFVLSFWNGYVGVSVDFAKSPLLASPPAPLTKPLTLKIVTFNIQDTWVVGSNRPERMRAIGEIVGRMDPDVVGFQEAFIDKERKILLDALAGSRLAYSQYFASGTLGSGLLIASAFPIKEAWFHRYAAANEWYKVWEGDWWAGKGAGLVRLELPGGGNLDFYDTHAQATYGNARYRLIRKDQMLELARFINDTRLRTVPAFLMGDMNCGAGKEDYEALLSCAKLTRAMGIDTHIDHIFAADNPKYTVEVLETVPIAEKVNVNGKRVDLSDHTGYMTTVRVTPVP